MFAEAKAACEGRGTVVETNVRTMVKAGKASAIESLLMPSGVGAGIFGQGGQQQGRAKRDYSMIVDQVWNCATVIAKRIAGQQWMAGHYAKQAKKTGKGSKYNKDLIPKLFCKAAGASEIDPDPTHQSLSALEDPNDVQGKFELIYCTVMNILATGEWYWIGGVDEEKKLRLYAVPTSLIQPDHSQGLFKGYKIITGLGTEVPIAKENVCRGYLPDPSDIRKSMSPLHACMSSARIDKFILSSQESSFERGINPNLLITVGEHIGPDGRAVTGSRPVLKGNQRRQIIRTVMHLWSQTVNQGMPAILDGLIKDVHKLQLTPQEMDWKQSGEVVKARIYQAFGVNPYVTGETTSGNRAQALVAEQNFAQNVVNPLIENISYAVTKFISTFYEDGENLAIWLEAAVPKDEEREDRQWHQARTVGDVSQEENRARLGLEPLPKKPPERSPLLNNPQTMTAIANLCAQVSGGALSHDAAVQILVTTLQIAPKDAEAMVPDDPPEPTPEELAAAQAAQQGPPGGAPAAGKKPPAKEFQLDDDAIDRIAIRLRQLGIGPSRGDRLGQQPKSPEASTIDPGLKFNENHDPETGRFTSGGGSGSSQQSGSGSESTGASNQGGSGDSGGVRGETSGVESSGVAAPVSTERLTGSPTSADIKGVGKVAIEPNIKLRQAAADYCKKAGIEYDPPTSYVKVDKERAKKIADAYEAMPNNPDDPEVKAAYSAMINETLAQYQQALDTGLKVEFIDYAKQGDPYAASPRLAIEDVKNNNHFWVFPTDSGFGSSDFDASKNPLLAPTQYQISGKTACANDIFRVVHDIFGHCKEGNGMRADGEENAWRSHSAMYSPLARRAMTTETRGQNSWVNFGPHAEHNKTASGGETKYADQKVGLLPEWITSEGAKAFEFIQFTKSLETKIARAAVKAAAAAQHTRVEKQAAQAFAKYFQKSVQDIVSRIPKSFKPDPENAKQQAASLIKRAFKASKQNDLLISSMSQPVADAFLEGAYAEMRLASAAKRRKKGLKFNENHDEAGRFASGGGSRSKEQADAIREYTDESNDVNGPLRDGGPESLTGRAKEIYETLQPMAKQPLPAPVTVYRGVQLPSDVEDSLTPGSEHSFPGMSSSSFDLEEAKVFGRRGVMLKITAKTGIVVGEDAATLSSGQKELIQAHGTMYRVIGDVDHSLPGHRRMIELEEIGHSKSLKYNENHDEAGRFASGLSGSGYSIDPASQFVVHNERERVQEILGREGESDKETLAYAAKLAGAPSGSHILLREVAGQVEATISNDDYAAVRVFDPKNKRIGNMGFEVMGKGKQGHGLGTEIFHAEVQEAAKAGYEKIITHAAGGPGMAHNGYYTWPRLGYDAEIATGSGSGLTPQSETMRVYDYVRSYAQEHGLNRISDFMRTAEHRSWWKEHGYGFTGEFDLRDGSQSRKVLEAYVQAKREQQSASGKSTGTDRGGGSSSGSNLGQPGQQQSGVKVTTATQAARRAEHEIDFPTEAPDWLTEAAQDFIIETFQEDYWLRIPETTRDDIELTLYNAIRDGKSIRDIAQEIQDAHGDEYSKYRAFNVARTEMTGAMNAGATESISQAFEGTGLTPTKVWLSVLGTTTRDTHAEADGQEVLLDAEFTVGGYQCNFPGDVSLPPEERCNCQCSLISGEVESQMSDEEDNKSLKFNENHDHLGRFASAPDSGDGSGAQGTSPSENPADKPPASPPKNVEEILKRSEKIQFTEGESELGVERDDYDAIERAMTPAERDDMQQAMDDDMREQIDSMMADWEAPESLIDDVDYDQAARDAGYKQNDIRDAAKEIVGDNEELNKIIDDWDGERGTDGIDNIIEELESSEAFTNEMRDKFDEYKSTAEDEIMSEADSQRDQLEEDARNAYREQLEEQWSNDNSSSRESYLENFYEDHPERFQSEDQLGKWVTDRRGNSHYAFKTSDNRQFSVDSYKQNKLGFDVSEIQFSDEEGDFGKTGKGKPFEVFGEVLPAVVGLIKHNDPKIVTFSAAFSDKNGNYPHRDDYDKRSGESRPRLYDALVSRILGVEDSRFAVKFDTESFREYIVGKKEDREAILAEVAKHSLSYMSGGQGPPVLEDIRPRRSTEDNVGVPTDIPLGFEEIQPSQDCSIYEPEFWTAWEAENGPYPGLANPKENPVKTFDPNQPRDDSGKWTSEGGSSTVGSDHAASGGEKPKVSDSDLSSDKLFKDHELALPSKSNQVKSTKEDLYQQAREEKPSFDVGLNTGQGVDAAIGANVARPSNAEEFKKAIDSDGPTVIIAGLKGEKRAEEKVNGKYGGDWSRLTDVIRATVAVSSKSEIPGAVDAVRKEMADHGWKIAEKPDNRITNPTPGGYRDLNLLFRSENGHLAEIQINTKAMIRAKEGDGHKLYEDYRRIDESIKSSNREPTTEEKDKLRTLSARMSSLYNDAWAK